MVAEDPSGIYTTQKGLSAAHCSIAKQQNDTTTDGNRDTSEVKSVDTANTELRPNKPTNKCANNTKNCRYNQTIYATTWHKKSRNCSSYQAEHDP
jgi:hypothetical protein|tara:strand:+ start:409 stop:693 length:285 start_codon:yes stop_codon:yes gene_type:complete